MNEEKTNAEVMNEIVTSSVTEAETPVVSVPVDLKDTEVAEATPQEDTSTFMDDLNLDDMNYVELSALMSDLQKNRSSLEGTFTLISHMKDVYTNASDLREAFDNAVASDPSLEKDREDVEDYINNTDKYIAKYQETIAKFDRSIAKLSAIIDERYGDVKKTMRFWDSQTIEYLVKLQKETYHKMEVGANLTAREVQRYKDTIHNCEEKLTAMDDRFDLKFWYDRSEMISHVKRIEKSIRKDFMKSLAITMQDIIRINSGVDKKSFMGIYGAICFDILEGADISIDEKRLGAQMFLASIAKVGKNPDTVIYATRLLNMIFSMNAKLYDYTDEGLDEVSMKAKIQEIILNYLKNTSSTTKKMYSRFMFSAKKNAK